MSLSHGKRARGSTSLGSGPAGCWWPLCARTVERASEVGRRGMGAACGMGWATRGAGERGVQPRVELAGFWAGVKGVGPRRKKEERAAVEVSGPNWISC